MNIRSSAAVFAILIGLGMKGLWIMLLLTGQVPELETEPARISLHLAAEFMTAIVLLVSGCLLFVRYPKADQIFLIGLGMLLYTVVQSAGYYIQLGQPGYIGMFAILFVAGFFFVSAALRGRFSH